MLHLAHLGDVFLYSSGLYNRLNFLDSGVLRRVFPKWREGRGMEKGLTHSIEMKGRPPPKKRVCSDPFFGSIPFSVHVVFLFVFSLLRLNGKLLV